MHCYVRGQESKGGDHAIVELVGATNADQINKESAYRGRKNKQMPSSAKKGQGGGIGRDIAHKKTALRECESQALKPYHSVLSLGGFAGRGASHEKAAIIRSLRLCTQATLRFHCQRNWAQVTRFLVTIYYMI